MSTFEQRPEEFDCVGIYENGRRIGSCPAMRGDQFIAEHIESNRRHWQGIVDRKADPRSVIADGGSYWIGSEGGEKHSRGFGGQPWVITFFDDRDVVHSTSLWFQGDIPAEWRNQLSDNAKLKAGRHG